MSENKYKYTWTTEDVAEEYGYHPQYVRDMARFGLIPARKRGRQWQFSPLELANFFKMQLEQTRQKALNYPTVSNTRGSIKDDQRGADSRKTDEDK